ncbi:MAG: hypothetical protein GY795_03255 [Desulfobacterales bacterium]|nr:hypothetical protein [Desulfobacterales bacterium]
MTNDEIEKFEKIYGQFEGLYREISILSKKSPNDAINKFKLSFINKLLAEAHVVLDEKQRPFEGFDNFDEDQLPTNSDITMIFEQYLNCFEKLRSDNIKHTWTYNGDKYVEKWIWLIDGEESEFQTAPPKKIKR